MKKLFIGLLCVLLISCSSSSSEPKEVDSKNAKLLNEVLALETKMQELHSFKISKVDDQEWMVCDGAEAKIKKESVTPKIYEIVKDDKDFAYRMKQKIEDQIQYDIEYYKQGKLYSEHSEMPGDISGPKEGASDYLILDFAVHAVDTNYFEIKKDKSGEKTQYTLILKKPKKYNKAYPSDKDDKACGIIGDYITQKIVIVVNKDGYIEEETIEETIKYKANDKESERLNIRKYQFYDYNVENAIDFYFAQ